MRDTTSRIELRYTPPPFVRLPKPIIIHLQRWIDVNERIGSIIYYAEILQFSFLSH